jgi:protein gp37
MGDKTKIEWADATWNPVVGCTPVSEGCKNCYAKRIYERFHPGQSFRKVNCFPEKLMEPSHWRNPRNIFVCSMSDLFHDEVPDEFISQVFDVIFHNRRHIYMILTKRPERMKTWVLSNQEKFWHYHAPGESQSEYVSAPYPDPCLWLGITVENQKAADERIPILLSIPAKVRFISCEPLLEPINLYDSKHLIGSHPTWLDGIDWVIVGGETGQSARPMNPLWALHILSQCEDTKTPFFFKKMGNNKSRLLRGREWNEYPK